MHTYEETLQALAEVVADFGPDHRNTECVYWVPEGMIVGNDGDDTVITLYVQDHPHTKRVPHCVIGNVLAKFDLLGAVEWNDSAVWSLLANGPLGDHFEEDAIDLLGNVQSLADGRDNDGQTEYATWAQALEIAKERVEDV